MIKKITLHISNYFEINSAIVLTSIYSAALINFILTASRDQILIHKFNGEGIKLLGELIFLNFMSLAVTEYNNNNKAWISKKISLRALILSIILVSVNNKFLSGCAYILSSITISYTCSTTYYKKRYTKIYIFSLLEVALQVMATSYMERMDIYVISIIRIVMACILVVIDGSEYAGSIKSNGTLDREQVYTTIVFLCVALTSLIFYRKVDKTSLVTIARFSTYTVSALTVSLNFIADKLVSKKSFRIEIMKSMQIYILCFIALICILIILALEFGLQTVPTILFCTLSFFYFLLFFVIRITSRVREIDTK